ncbi:MAG: trypsin-like peptidase domain-containing protein [Planctomycetota bacterium]
MHRLVTRAAVGLLIVATASIATAQDSLGYRRSGRVVLNTRDNVLMMQLVRPLATQLAPSVARVISNDRPVAYATIVTTDGYVLTKHSELSGDPIKVRLSTGRRLPARVAAVRPSNDLALLKVESSEPLAAVQFHTESPAVGSFVITAGNIGRPIGLGVVGVSERPVQHTGRLGVVLRQSSGGGASVSEIYPNSGAEFAGIVKGDRIIAIDGLQQPDHSSVKSTLGRYYPGDRVRLTIVREGDQLEMNARIRDLSLMQETENDAKVNGPRNARLSGFDSVIQHDTVLDIDQCGGPLLDTSGHVVGINIARAGRVVSYALPATLLERETKAMLRDARRPD